MNVYAIVVLAALLLDELLGLVADWHNLRSLGEEVPAALRGVYDPDEFRRSQRYARERTRFSRLESTVGLVLFLVFWAAGGFGWLDRAVRSLGWGEVATGLLFIGALAVAKEVLSIPWSAYSTFVIEERYGFNRTTPRTFVLDLVKGALLAVILGAPLLAAVLWFFEAAGAAAWLYCWLVTSVFTLVLAAVVPTWILPLFNKFEPLEDGGLRDALSSYARSVDFALEGIFVVDGSRRSSRGNAFFSGFGRGKRVALFDTLVERHDKDELVAVLAHEIGHYRLRHIVKMLVVGVLHNGVVFYLLSLALTLGGLFTAFGVAQPSVHAGLVFFGLLYAPIERLLSLGLNALSRKHEFEADRFAVDTVEEPGAMATALAKLSAENLSNPTPHPFYVVLHHSHPPILERLGAIERRISERGARPAAA